MHRDSEKPKPPDVGPIAVRVNAGGPPYQDREGRSWLRDKGYHKGSWGCSSLADTDILTTTDPIEGTEDATIYQTMRVGEELRYRFDVPNGLYRVRILFAETYWESSDAEQQDVYIQGKRVLRGYNIYDEAGHDVAVAKEYQAQVTAGHLIVRFVGRSLPMHSGARACGIAIERIPTGR